MSEHTALQSLFDGTLRNSSGNATCALLVYGAPNTGKTQFAVRAAIAGYKRWPHKITAMAVQNRTLAANIDNIIIRSIGVSEQSRPVGTLASLAFRIISANCKSQNLPSPKLLNGAEQDALLRNVVRAHIEHVIRGDNGDCTVCSLFEEYFGTSTWVNPLTCAGELNDSSSATAASSSDISSAFMHQLRDMLARLDELGISDNPAISNNLKEQNILDSLDLAQSRAKSGDILQTTVLVKRRRAQWRLVFALRSEYRKMIADVYKSSFRLDASKLLVEGAKAARELGEQSVVNSEIPALLVIDDYQDITLAGLSFVETLSSLGTRLVLLANPDESVQSFRGAYPDYAISAALNVLNAAEQTLEYEASSAPSVSSAPSASSASSNSTFANRPKASSMLDLLASRVSLSLSSQLDSSIATPNRPWKMPAFAGAFPVQSLNQINNIHNSQDSQKYLRINEDGTVNTALYRSQREELDAVIWQMKQSHVNNKRKWSDMALIAHDNSTVRLFGEQLRADGVPVRYSLVTRPLKDEPFVQGLFAIIELAQFAHSGFSGIARQLNSGRSLKNLASWVRLRVQNIMDSPLASIPQMRAGSYAEDNSDSPAKLHSVESLMRSIASLSAVLDAKKDEDDSAEIKNIPLRNLMNTWCDFRNKLQNALRSNADSAQISVDNRFIEGDLSSDFSEDMRSLSLDACYLLCVAYVAHCVDGTDNTDCTDAPESSHILQILQNMAPRNPHVTAFVKMWKNVQTLALRFKNHPDLLNAQYALGEAWNICNVAERWQRAALQHNSEGRRANDRLDAAMRLFDYVSSYASSESSSYASAEFSSEFSSEFSYNNFPDDTFDQENIVNIADFIAQVRGMEIEADSLAKVAPHPDAVTLTTPAGALGKHWPLVWIPTLQQRVWPNLASRSTMFGAESLANIILDSKLRAMSQKQLDSDSPLKPASQSPLFISANLLSSNDKSAVFAGEQRSFLLAITRATESLYISAQYSDSAVPSDFLYYYLPERYYNNENSRTPFTEITIPFAGLDMDARGLVCAARAQISRAVAGKSPCNDADIYSSSDISNSSEFTDVIYDSAKALQLLRQHGVDCADPSQWDFMNDITKDSTENTASSSEDFAPEDVSSKDFASRATSLENSSRAAISEDSSCVVSLSPSAVDSLWACPVCGLLNRQLSGPQPGSAATYFGTLIHETARWASENQHYDMPETEVAETEIQEPNIPETEYSPYSPQVRRINAIANLMEKYYASIAPELADIRNSRERYSALARETNISRALHTIAQYFVTSYDQSTYACDAKKSDEGVLESLTKSEKSLESSIGVLQEAYCEFKTSAHFGFENIAMLVNNALKASNLQTIKLHDVYELMGALVGGWPDGANENLIVHIHGRIDRMEKRKNSDGSKNIRLIDYKTGKVPPSTGVFNDLQLVCYQLALLFADKDPLISALDAPTISRSVLFHVVSNDYPAQDHHVAENVYQPPLCVGNALNNQPLETRVGFKTMSRLMDCPNLAQIMKSCPSGVSEEAWQSFRALSETAKWSLTMISRVFYAAAATNSWQIVARPTSEHLKYCRSKQVCPACAGSIDTVYEVRQL